MNENVMRIIGSGAAEAIPDPFCRCDICSNARIVKGKEVRSRSSFRVNKGVQIDFGADQFYQSIILENDLTTLEDILITHTHSDHFNFTELSLKEMATTGNEKPLNIFLIEEGYRWFESIATAYPRRRYFDNKNYNIIPIKYQESYVLDNITFIPLKGNHRSYGNGEYSVNYLISLENNKKLYYAVDTGYFLEDTFEFLKDHTIDYLVIEGTFGDAHIEKKPLEHLGCESIIDIIKRLLNQGTLTNNSKVYITHINHKHTLTHEKIVKYFKELDLPVEVTIGYDGMKIIK